MSAYATGGSYRARLVRVLSGDPNPDGPGMRFEDLSHRFDQSFAGRRQPIHLGSYGVVGASPTRDTNAACTWTVLARLGLADAGQVMLAEESGEASIALLIGANGATARIRSHGKTIELATGTPMQRARWYRVWLAADPTGGRMLIGQHPLDGAPVTAQASAPGVALPSRGTLLIAAENATAPQHHFTGKLEDPAILRGFVTSWPDAGAPLDALPGDLLAGWDFSRCIDTQELNDIGPQACHGRLVNMPTRAMVGTRWTGREQCWRHAPHDYGAIHFHADDLGDCGWQADFSWTVPDDLRSGAYALHLTCDAGEDWLPLYVLPRRQGPFAPIAFLASTFTYQAYANHERSSVDAGYYERVAAWRAYPYNPRDYPIYGRSTYNRHIDGSGISFSSRHRPILTMRPGFLTFCDPRGSGMRHYPADLHLLAWLEAKGFDFDIVTDEDLDDEGVALIAPYRTVLTGSHPEYHTLGTIDALAAYTQQGGRLCYLGGNGFYWRVARDKANPHLIELRRAEGGIRTWAAEPGEYFHQTDGQLGGLWRRNRRPPQMLVGVGFSCQAAFESTHYRRLPASRRSALRLDVRRHRGRRAWRLWIVRRRRGWFRTGSRRPDAGHAGQRGDSGTLGKPAALVLHRAGRVAVQRDQHEWRADRGPVAWRDRVFRHAVRRRCVLCWLDHLLRQPLAQRRLRRPDLAVAGKRRPPLFRWVMPMPDNTAQRRSRSYKLPVEDLDFLLRDEVRDIRFALEYAKAELLLRDWGIRSTVIIFGSARTPSPEQAEAAMAAATTDAERAQPQRMLQRSAHYSAARELGRIISRTRRCLRPARSLA